MHWWNKDVFNLGGVDAPDSFRIDDDDDDGGFSSSSIDEELLKKFHITCFVAAGCYFIPAIPAFFQLVKFIRVPYLPRFVLHKAYALLLIIAVFLRVVFFLLSGLLSSGFEYFYGSKSRRGSPAFSVMSDLGEMFFFFAFSLLGLFWAEIHYNTSKRQEKFERRVKPLFFTVMAVFLFVEFCCWVLLFVLPEYCSKTIEISHDIGYLVVYAICTVFTIAYCNCVFQRVYSNPLHSAARSKKLFELVIVTTGCMMFLLFHAASTSLYIASIDMHQIGFQWLTAIAFVCEVIPSLLLLFILRHIPQQPGPAQPINSTSQHVYSYSIIRDGSLPAALVSDMEKK